MSLWLQVFAVLCLYSYNPPGVVAASSDFRGGFITWKPIPDQPNQVSYKLHIYSKLIRSLFKGIVCTHKN